MSVRMIDGASGLMCGVANHLMCGVAYHLMCAGVSGPMSAGGNGRTRVVTEILVAGPTPARVMVATTHCRMANAGRTFGAEPTCPMSAVGNSVTHSQANGYPEPHRQSTRCSSGKISVAHRFFFIPRRDHSAFAGEVEPSLQYLPADRTGDVADYLKATPTFHRALSPSRQSNSAAAVSHLAN